MSKAKHYTGQHKDETSVSHNNQLRLSHSRHFNLCLKRRNSSPLDVKLSSFALMAVRQICTVDAGYIARQQRRPDQGLDVNFVTNN